MYAFSFSFLAPIAIRFSVAFNRKTLLYFSLVLSFPHLIGQSTGILESGKLKEKGLAFLPEKPDSALYYIKLAQDSYLSEGDTLNSIECHYAMIDPLYYLGQENGIDSMLMVNWELAQRYLSPEIPKQASGYAFASLHMGYALRNQNKFLESIPYFEKGFEIFDSQDSIPQKYITFFYQSFNIAGIGFAEIGDNEEALKYYKRSLQAYKLGLDDDPYRRIPRYLNIGTTFLERNQEDSALAYFQKVETLLVEMSEEHYNYTIFQAAFNILKAGVFRKIDHPDSMIIYAKKGLAESEKIQYKEFSSRANVYIGEALTKMGKFNEAEKNLLAALKINDSLNANISPRDKFYTFRKIGDMYVAKGFFDKAQEFYDLGFKLITAQSTLDNLSGSLMGDPYQGLLVLQDKMKCFVLQEDIGLSQTINYSNLANDLVLSLRKSFQAEGSKLDLAKRSHNIFENSLFLLDRLSKTANWDTTLNAGFTYIESSKSVLLFEALLNREARLGLPERLRERERIYKRDIAYYEKYLFDDQKRKEKNAERKDQVEERLFSIQQNYKRFTDTLEQFYPAYYQQKYRIEQLQVKEVQNELRPSQAFLQYFVGDSNIFVIGIHPEKQVFTRFPLTDTLLASITSYLQFLSSLGELESPEYANQYTHDALFIFQHILAPVLNQLPKEITQLIISPDGILSYLPFEAFLVEAVEGPLRFPELPYLLHSYAISYTHSATNWMEQKEKIAEKVSNNWLGFAPSYEEAQIKESVQPLAIDRFLTRDGSVQLPHAQEEISQIAALTNGDGFFQRTALESGFHTLAPNYKILHLATHGLVEDQESMYSRLVFAPE
ncbi:MAG: CHAT domain-containing protein, partial [Bacteroidota bacterium]